VGSGNSFDLWQGAKHGFQGLSRFPIAPVSDRLFADCNERFSRISAVPRVSPREGAFIHRRCAYVVGVRRRNC
jgi:hypothetical protein